MKIIMSRLTALWLRDLLYNSLNHLLEGYDLEIKDYYGGLRVWLERDEINPDYNERMVEIEISDSWIKQGFPPTQGEEK